METKSKNLEGNKREITVSLTSDEVQVEIDAAYKQAGKARIPGFRPGKAPRKVLENNYGGKEYFQATATEELVNTFAPLAQDELNLVALGNPEFEKIDPAVEGEPFTFTFSLEVTPEYELSSYDPIQIELPSVEATDEEMQAQIDMLLSYNTAQDEDGTEQVPELTDAWVKETLEFDTVDAFKERLAASIREQKEQEIGTLKEVFTLQRLASRLEGEVPEALIRQTEQENYRDLFKSLDQQRITLDAYLEGNGLTPESFRESMRQQAVNSAEMSLALDAWARHFELVASDEEITEEFKNSGVKEHQKLFEEWKRTGRLSEIRQGLARMKASQNIADTVEITEVETLIPQVEDEGESVEASEKADEAKKPKKRAAKKSTKAADEADVEVKEEKKPKASKAKAEEAEKKPAKKPRASKKTDKAKEADDKTADDTK